MDDRKKKSGDKQNDRNYSPLQGFEWLLDNIRYSSMYLFS